MTWRDGARATGFDAGGTGDVVIEWRWCATIRGGIKMTLSITSSIAVGTFATVILAIASNRIHLTVAAMLGTVVLLVTGVLSARDVSETINPAEAMIALFFGGMVMARTLIATTVDCRGL
jgi:hypothetical protein